MQFIGLTKKLSQKNERAIFIIGKISFYNSLVIINIGIISKL